MERSPTFLLRSASSLFSRESTYAQSTPPRKLAKKGEGVAAGQRGIAWPNHWAGSRYICVFQRILCVSIPRTDALPAVGRISSMIVRIVVVLPAPLSPRSRNTSPGYMFRLRSGQSAELAVVFGEVLGYGSGLRFHHISPMSRIVRSVRISA